ncbi:leucyl aminopeptidase [Sulfurirhabdus autotrophica]|uniref:Probable cytosol aminopeptidase n=1 Tax=Sulfurirhabdus autotrophica TaxID=1706046 RepID=A0A4R3XUK4_9PROT|nr:leucyl aminopeptidase [Sulfurirhabdus autotrophica]TCV82567.1 aminopeptidase A [Sulfurirhabdus autotrophica]
MEFSIKSGSPEKQRTACVVVGVFEPRKLTLAGDLIDRVSDGYISDIIRRGDMEGKLGTTLLLHNVPNTLCDRVLLVGLGKERDFKDKEYRTAVSSSIRNLNETGSMEAVIFLTELQVRKRDTAWKIEQTVLMAMESTYRFDRLKSKLSDVRRPLRKLTLGVSRRNELADGEAAVSRGLAIAQGMNMAKDLGNLPGNYCTPSYLAEQAQGLAKTLNMKAEILEQKDMEKLGMGAFLSVAKGSRQPPKLIVLHYQGGDKKRKPVVLVGKGVTFDAGGISLKPAAEMDEMKYDMGGAASVLGTMKAIAQMRIPLNVIAIIPACENLPDGNANKPGDVITSMSGQTIEVLNTDAEGRLILCDALTYAERFEPEVVIDIATLTGACVIALGAHASGLFSNDDSLAREVLHAGEYAHDRAWHMPMWDEYQEQLKSNFADMANIGGRAGGSITAACFLSRFTKKYDWAHLDIAGTAWKSGKDKGGTGRPVPLLTHFLINRAKD